MNGGDMQETGNDRRRAARQGTEGLRTLSVHVDHALVHRMVERCETVGLSMTEAVTEALSHYLATKNSTP